MIKEKIMAAYQYAQTMHDGQFRKFSGLPYFSHPKAVARIVENLTQSENLIIASFLHDTVEDTEATLEEITQLFGETVANLINELTSDKPKKMDKAEYLYRKMQNMSDEALVVKLADRLHNVMYLEDDKVNKAFVEKYYRETRRILEKLERDYTYVQFLLIRRIEIILDFLQVRYDF